MLLIRLAHIGTLPTPGDLIKRLTSAGPESLAVTGAAALPSSTGGAPVMRVVGLHTTTTTLAAPMTAALPRPADWQAVVALVAEHREMQLYAQLHSQIVCHAFAPGRLELFPRPGAPADVTTRLARGLAEWTGMPWLISLAKDSDQPTLAEQEDARHQSILQEAAAHPLVQSVLLAFPGAKIEAVRDLVTEDPPTTTDTPADDMLDALMLDDNDG